MYRLVIAVILFLLGLLCIFPAPEQHLWLVSVLTTEFPWIFMLICLLLLAWGRVVHRFWVAGNVICFAALGAFIYPVISAYILAEDLHQDFEKAFYAQQDPLQTAPFSFFSMFTGLGEKQVSFTVHNYVSTPSGPLTLDYYQAAATSPKPCVIVIHGGSWCGGNSQQLPELNTWLAKRGYNVASINYRLAPKDKWPAQINDVRSSMAYLRQHAAEFNIDTNNFILLGRSAGGQIALAAAYTFPEKSLKGVINFYGPADMAWGYNHPANPLVLDTREIMEDYLGGSVSEVPRNYTASSATEIASPSATPTLMIFGKNDPLVPYGNGTKLNAVLNANGVKNYLLLLPWATHGCDYTLHGPSGQLSTYTIELFLRNVIH